MKQKITLLLAILLISSLAYAQNEFQPVERALVDGFIVLNNGERMEGRIQVQKLNKMSETVIFFDHINIKRVYKPEDVDSYGLNLVSQNNDGDLKREWKNFEAKKSQADEVLFVQN